MHKVLIPKCMVNKNLDLTEMSLTGYVAEKIFIRRKKREVSYQFHMCFLHFSISKLYLL